MSDCKKQSNPFSTGGGGPNFETRIQAAFAVLMLTGGPAPCFPLYQIVKLKLQGRYADFNTDDLIVYLKQAQTVALEGITVGGKTMREHLEAINHREAIFFVEELVSQKEPLSQQHIKDIHQLILKKIDDQNAGIYRNTNVIIAGAEHTPSDFIHVLSEMENLIRWYQNEAQELHPVERAGRVHAGFVKIHPFIDGNGRTSRLLMNLELMKAGFPAAVLPVEKRLEYYNALEQAHTQNNYQPFLSLIIEIVELSFQPYWHALNIK